MTPLTTRADNIFEFILEVHMYNSQINLKSQLRSPWAYALLGLLFCGLGVLAFTYPIAGYLNLVGVFSIGFVITGTARLAFAINNRKTILDWGWYLVSGLLELSLGIVFVTHPGVTAATFPLFIGFFILINSLSAMANSFDMKEFGYKNWGVMLASGILGFLCSLAVLANPIVGFVSALVWASFAFFANAMFCFSYAYEIRKLNQSDKAHPTIKGLHA